MANCGKIHLTFLPTLNEGLCVERLARGPGESHAAHSAGFGVQGQLPEQCKGMVRIDPATGGKFLHEILVQIDTIFDDGLDIRRGQGEIM